MRKALLCALFWLCTFNLFAQDPLTDQFLFYQKAKPTTNLFVHFDKNVYASNETVWFSGYLIATKDFGKHHIMSVSLIKESNNKVVLEDRFIMKNGFSFGNITLPDSIPVGNYRFLVITDYVLNNQPEVSFTQPITIKSVLEPPFKASMKTMSTENITSKVMVSVTTADNRFLEQPTDVYYTYGNLKKTMKTDASGQAVIHLEQQDNLSDPNLYVKLKYGKDSTFINMPLNQPKGTPFVKFYPEGGDMIGGLINNIGWEVRDRQKKPVAVKAYLYKNNIAIDTLMSSNSGLGSFKMFADQGAKYTFKVIGANLKDTVFTLPNIKENGIGINIINAVVSDTLKINLRSKLPQKINLRIHNFRESYLYTKIDIQPGLKTLKIPLFRVKKGLATVTITDSLERPIVERIFFAHYDNAEKIGIVTDKAIYGLREKVNLKLNLKNISENAVVSVAVVQDNRMETGKVTDIESYTYLNNELDKVPVNTKGNTYKDKKYLEQLLLIKGWRRYNWPELITAKATDTSVNYNQLFFTGNVTKSRKPLKEAVAIGAMGDEKIRLVTTETNGTFDFNHPELYTSAGKKMFMFLNKNNDPSYKFAINNQLLETSEKIAVIPTLNEKPPILQLSDNGDLFVKSNEKSIRLKEVQISGKVKTSGLGPNPCGDYVCQKNILNCRNHYGDPNNRQPIQGKTYSSGSQSIVYQGCGVTDESIFFKTEGIHLHKEFYVDSYKDPLEPAYFSTIFWNYALVLNKDKETSIDFYTSDVPGKYRIVVQGITQTQVIYNENFFEIKRK